MAAAITSRTYAPEPCAPLNNSAGPYHGVIIADMQRVFKRHSTTIHRRSAG